MNGAVELQKAAQKHGIKPIIGCEIYFIDDHVKAQTEKVERNHLTLLAETDEGYRNLVKLSSAGFLEGLNRGKPTVDMGQLAAARRGHHRADRLPGLALLPPPGAGPTRTRPAPTPTTC